MPPIYHHRHTVLQSEIDSLGHANNVAYVEWMQLAAVAHSAAQGWPGDWTARIQVRPAQDIEISDETIRKLRSLGYLQ